MRTIPAILATILLLAFASACQTNPVKEAQAFAIQEEAQQDALNQEQNRLQAADLHAQQLRQLEVETQRKEATAKEWSNRLNIMIKWGMVAATIALCITIAFATRTTVQTIEGLGNAVQVKALITAGRLPIGRSGNYDAFILKLGNGRYALTDPNTGRSIFLDENNKGDAQMIAGAMASRHTYVLAAHARPDVTVTQIDPPIIHPQTIDIDEIRSLMIPLPHEEDA